MFSFRKGIPQILKSLLLLEPGYERLTDPLNRQLPSNNSSLNANLSLTDLDQTLDIQGKKDMEKSDIKENKTSSQHEADQFILEKNTVESVQIKNKLDNSENKDAHVVIAESKATSVILTETKDVQVDDKESNITQVNTKELATPDIKELKTPTPLDIIPIKEIQEDITESKTTKSIDPQIELGRSINIEPKNTVSANESRLSPINKIKIAPLKNKITITLGQALLILLDHYQDNKKIAEQLKILYLRGAEKKEDLEEINIFLKDPLLQNYIVTTSARDINEDPCRRYFESHLAYETLCTNLRVLESENLEEYKDEILELLPEIRHDKYKKILNGDASVKHGNIGYSFAIDRLKSSKYSSDSQQDQSYSYFINENLNVKLQELYRIGYLAVTASKAREYPIDIYNGSHPYFSENGRGRVLKRDQRKVHSHHMALMRSYMPVPQNDILYSTIPYCYTKPVDVYNFDKDAAWPKFNFKHMIHPYSCSISGTFLIVLRVAKYLNSTDKRYFPYADTDKFHNFLKCFIAGMLYKGGGHSLFEFVSVLKEKEVQQAFSFIKNFESLDVTNLFYVGNQVEFDKAMRDTILYNRQILRRSQYQLNLKEIQLEETKFSNRNKLSELSNWVKKEYKITTMPVIELKNIATLCDDDPSAIARYIGRRIVNVLNQNLKSLNREYSNFNYNGDNRWLPYSNVLLDVLKEELNKWHLKMDVEFFEISDNQKLMRFRQELFNIHFFHFCYQNEIIFSKSQWHKQTLENGYSVYYFKDKKGITWLRNKTGKLLTWQNIATFSSSVSPAKLLSECIVNELSDLKTSYLHLQQSDIINMRSLNPPSLKEYIKKYCTNLNISNESNNTYKCLLTNKSDWHLLKKYFETEMMEYFATEQQEYLVDFFRLLIANPSQPNDHRFTTQDSNYCNIHIFRFINKGAVEAFKKVIFLLPNINLHKVVEISLQQNQLAILICLIENNFYSALEILQKAIDFNAFEIANGLIQSLKLNTHQLDSKRESENYHDLSQDQKIIESTRPYHIYRSSPFFRAIFQAQRYYESCFYARPQKKFRNKNENKLAMTFIENEIKLFMKKKFFLINAKYGAEIAKALSEQLQEDYNPDKYKDKPYLDALNSIQKFNKGDYKELSNTFNKNYLICSKEIRYIDFLLFKNNNITSWGWRFADMFDAIIYDLNISSNKSEQWLSNKHTQLLPDGNIATITESKFINSLQIIDPSTDKIIKQFIVNDISKMLVTPNGELILDDRSGKIIIFDPHEEIFESFNIYNNLNLIDLLELEDGDVHCVLSSNDKINGVTAFYSLKHHCFIHALKFSADYIEITHSGFLALGCKINDNQSVVNIYDPNSINPLYETWRKLKSIEPPYTTTPEQTMELLNIPKKHFEFVKAVVDTKNCDPEMLKKIRANLPFITVGEGFDHANLPAAGELCATISYSGAMSGFRVLCNDKIIIAGSGAKDSINMYSISGEILQNITSQNYSQYSGGTSHLVELNYGDIAASNIHNKTIQIYNTCGFFKYQIDNIPIGSNSALMYTCEKYLTEKLTPKEEKTSTPNKIRA